MTGKQKNSVQEGHQTPKHDVEERVWRQKQRT